MTDETKKILNKYGIDDSDLKRFDFDISDKIIESGKRLAQIWTPLIANINFSEFKEDLKNGYYDKVYASPVFNTINNLCLEDNIITIPKEKKVIRARIIKDVNDIYCARKGIHFENDCLRGYDWINSKEPAVGISSEGRANSQYSSYFYCAEDGPTAASETKANIGDYISIASFVIKQDFKLVRFDEKDISDVGTIQEWYKNYIAKHFSAPVNDLQEYRLTQFISDEIRKHGVDGICFKSHFTNKDNYVIFNCSMESIQFFKSKIIQLHSQQLKFIDFSGLTILSTNAMPNPTKEDIEREKKFIHGMIRSYEDKKNADNIHNQEDANNG